MPDLLRQPLDALRRAVAPSRATMNVRRHRQQLVMTVDRVEQVHDRLRRITFIAPELRDLVLTGPDEQAGLLLPPGDQAVHLPDLHVPSIRTALAAVPADVRPTLRWYAVRAHRPEAGELDVEVVLHDDGPGTTWAAAAQPGDRIGLRAGASGYRPPSRPVPQLLVADETALPALAAILEQLPVQAEPVHSIVEVPSERYRVTIETPYAIEWVYRHDGDPGSRAVYTAKTSPLDRIGYAWVCGEVGMATAVRRHLVKERDVDADDIFFSGYWKRGAAAG